MAGSEGLFDTQYRYSIVASHFRVQYVPSYRSFILGACKKSDDKN